MTASAGFSQHSHSIDLLSNTTSFWRILLHSGVKDDLNPTFCYMVQIRSVLKDMVAFVCTYCTLETKSLSFGYYPLGDIKVGKILELHGDF